ncbi:MAG: hypothetical protein E7403_03345 [Ruminococcaceae bacterium]|nr:hypothetical protein [Oscillospiraceae bacterium]
MILQKIEIEQFAGLKNYTLELKPGFQYLYGHNEAGKSTICAFLSVMFYGLPPKKSKDGIKGDGRLFYMPWGERYMAGTVYFEDKGKEYVLKRRFGKTAKGDSCTLHSGADWTEIPIDAKTVGQHFFGMGADAFGKSLFISQLGAAFAKGKEDELMERLSNLEKTGDEDASIQKAIKILTDAEYELVSKTGRGGAILQIEQEIEQLSVERIAARHKNLSFRDLLEEISQLTKERDEAVSALSETEEKRKQAQAYEQYAARKEQRKQQQDMAERLAKERSAFARAEQELAEVQGRLVSYAAVAALETDVVLQLAEKESVCKILSEKEEKLSALSAEASRMEAELTEAENKAKKRVNVAVLSVAVVLLLLGIILGIVWHPVAFVFSAIGVAIGLLSLSGDKEIKQAKQDMAVLSAQIAEKKKEEAALQAENISQKLKQYRGELEFVFRQAGTDSLTGLAEKIETARTLEHKKESLEKEKQRLADSVAQLEASLKMMPEISEEPPVAYEGPSVKMLEDQLKRMQNEQLERERKLAQMNARATEGFSGTRGVSVIESELADAQERKAEMVKRYEAIRLAREAMEQCAEELKSNFAPVLNEKSGALIKRLTGGRYREVKVTDDYTMMLKTPSGTEIINSDYVSAGTCDLLYFALRLAVLQTLYDAVPLLIMDDTFLQFDKERQQAAFDLLKENPAEQILYFSCHEPAQDLNLTVQTISNN